MELLERGPILDQLHSLLNDAERGRGRLVAIAGEAGIGKSVLIRHFCESVSNRADVFIGSCDPLSTPTPFGPVLDIAPELGGDFEDLLREPSPVRRLGNALLARRGVRPRVLVFEDMHWADDATLEAAAQYARALQWAHQLDARQRALLLRARSAECFLIDQAPEASEARRAAIGIWHELGDREQEGDDLCWLSRAYWLAGNNAETEHAIERALQLLEHGRPGLPLARALSTYAQLRFLSCDYEKAIAAAERAITIAGTSTEHNASDVMLHAALSRDASRWAMDDDAGRSQLEATLQACLSRGLHEPAARAFSLLTGAWSGRYVLQSAEKSIEQGLAYLQEHDLDLYRHTLISSKCSLLLRRGRWTEALELANLIDASPEYAAVHRISALTVIGLVRGRRGEPGAWQPLDTALELADRIGEPHRVVPVRTARAEVAWLAHDLVRAADEARPAFELAIQNPFRWYAVEPAVWLWRAGQLPAVHPDLPAPD